MHSTKDQRLKSGNRLGARPGNMILTSFIIVLGLSMMISGISVMLKEQIRQSANVKGVSLGKLQAYYLAEMGVNHWMYTANQNVLAPFPTATAVGTMDFKQNVAMVRSSASGSATCVAGMTPSALLTQGYPQYQVAATLVIPDGTFTQTVYFDVSKLNNSGSQYVLSRYRSQ